MKKKLMLAVMIMIAVTAHAMSYDVAKKEALFLSDKMAHELSLTVEQLEAVYEINLDYLLCLNGIDDILGTCWARRNADLRYVLSSWQYDKFLAIEYFYRPVRWEADAWLFAVYDHYKRKKFFFDHPKAYKTYQGGNSAMAADFYAHRIAEKPASAAHSLGPAPRDARPATPDARPATPDARPTVPNNRPAGGMGPRPGGMGPGGMGGRPMGGPGRR